MLSINAFYKQSLTINYSLFTLSQELIKKSLITKIETSVL